MAAHDKNFDVIPIGHTFFFIWRIKQFELVPVPKEDYGKFYKGDCYIVACCTENPTGGHSKMESKPILNGHGYCHIHFWIGSESTKDEAGVAAIKSVELDDFLGGYPVQHREIEEFESRQFSSYFKNGIIYLKGGYESGFTKMIDELKPSLLHVKGKKRPIVYECAEISWKVMNNGDVFILLVPNFVFVWTGKHSNRMERTTAIRVANDLKSELNRFKLSSVILEDGKEVEQTSGAEYDAFNKALSLDKKDIDLKQMPKGYDYAASDKSFESHERSFVTLYKCFEGTETIDISFVKNGPLSRADLDTNDTFIVENGSEGLWVWVGKKATQKERQSAIKYAMELINKKKYPNNTPVTKVLEGDESVEFKSLFESWQMSEQEKITSARLFRVSRNGIFKQVANYEPDDLEEDNIMILDVMDKIYVWIGNQFAERIADEAHVDKVAQRFIQEDKSGRKFQPNQIIKLKQGSEDGAFKSYFPKWN
ncbi:actin depolymerizing venom protein gelsolin 1 isoform X1 [Dermatophagoides farinae]|uniref:Der f 16 allergen n=1 Tax=Dermatophagoides farinae TaxID=6954 RepID=Q8MVU3_DERFA|nr:gelsolin-like protein 1 [Dermatophagoides farinae]AAM64112.1 gelsolin-like allergen Der f 16 [Dermatophagoides farinae]AIO08859.1 Der f 16 allergen [Dermatophagoides farinae]KAH7637899.1 gelsolin-like allergen der f 16 [Dermatophagoides farinae]KAH9501378.1 hypothetical protein DERF_012229 [Dermatophagoides farinae]KAH9501379.1 hypothetical protein DERF_012229 [Dermatophagoides farinae]